MLTRYYDSVRTPMLDLFDPFKIFDEIEKPVARHRSDTIDESGVKIELPGVKATDLDISVDGRTLKVSGKSRHGKEFSYTYTLRSTVDDSAIAASFQDGLLEISLPKKQETTVRKIPISAS